MSAHISFEIFKDNERCMVINAAHNDNLSCDEKCSLQERIVWNLVKIVHMWDKEYMHSLRAYT